MMSYTPVANPKTAEDFRESAARHDQEAYDSFERCDTDGFLSQWAHGVNAGKDRLQAEIIENGGMWEFSALFDLRGNLVPAKEVKTPYGYSWGLLDEANPEGRFLGFFNPSKAQSDSRRFKANAAKGYRMGRILAPAKAVLRGGKCMTSVCACVARTDGGFSRTVEVVEIDPVE